MATDTPLARLCQYYLDCLSHEDLGGVSIPAGSDIGVREYAELEISPFAGDASALHSPAPQEFLNELERDMNRKTLFLGYPVRLKEIGRNRFKIEPLFLFSFQEQYADQGNATLLVDIPQINFDALKSLTNPRQVSLFQEAADLAEKLDLEDRTEEPRGLEEVVARLRQIRPAWDWREEIHPGTLSNGVRLEDVTQQGIYNRCILIASEPSDYTRGLETELKRLQAVPEMQYESTALGSWLQPQTAAAPPTANRPLVEVSPLNAEQRQAVREALANPLTVISGPPGTGKSQVATAIVINAAIRGKTVLLASKNNRAVDEVERRVNSTESRPVLLRVGSSDYRQALPQYLVALLDTAALPGDQERLHACEARNAELQQRADALDEALQSVIELLNEMDRLEHEVEQTRGVLGEQGFAALRELDWEALKKSVEILSSATQSATKAEQSFALRSIWPLISRRRFRHVAEVGAPLRVELEQLGCSLPIGIPDSSSIQEWILLAERLVERVPQWSEAQLYFQKLDELNRLESLESLARRRRELTVAFCVCSADLWKAWLRLQPSRMNDMQRRRINDLRAQLTLMMGANDAQAPGPAIFRDLLLQIPSLFPCWAVTALSARGRIPLEPGLFDLLIIDEASQCDIASALPLLFRAKQVVILGDLKQLPHISKVLQQQDFQLLTKHGLWEDRPGWSYSVTSLFQLADVLPNRKVMLRDHHRSHAQIIEFSNEHFYQSGPLRIVTRYDRLRIPYPDQPAIRWVDVQSPTIFALGDEGGAVNEAEAQAIVIEVERLIQGGYRGSIGVVSPFRAQVNRIRQMVSQRPGLAQGLGEADFLCGTAHSFQGDERDVMFFSPAVSDNMPRGARWFVDASPDSKNLFNVAITRARAALIVVGNRNAMRNCDSVHLQEFVRYTENLEATQPVNVTMPNTSGCDYPIVAHPDRVSDWERYFYPHLCRRLELIQAQPIPQYRAENSTLDACDFALFVGNRKLDIEIDGEFHHRNWDGELCRRDQIRTQMLIDLGWDVMRFWVYQVRDDLDLCLARIEKWASKASSAVDRVAEAQASWDRTGKATQDDPTFQVPY
jgi:very-short-patch-repair endonuclease